MFLSKANKAKVYSVAKYYLVLNQNSWTDLIQDIDTYISLTSMSVDEYSVNYLTNKKFQTDKFKGSLLSYDIENIESVRLERSYDNLGIFIGSEFKYLGLESVYELSFVTPLLGESFYSMFTSISKALIEKSKVLYGYGRELSANVDPTTENAIKKSLFGNVSVQVDKAVDIWFEHPSQIKSGSIKGVYSLNLLPHDKLNTGIFEKLISSHKLKVEALGNDFELVAITHNQLNTIRSASKDIAQYVRM